MTENVNNKITTTVELDSNQAQQEIVKLNSLASDGTQELSTRLEAKNKQIEIQNNLNKKNIKDLEALVKSLKNQEGKEKELEKAQKKLNKAKLNEVKVNERNSKAQRKLQDSYAKSKGSLNKLNKATGGFIDKLKLLAANPIVLILTGIVGALKLLQKAFVSSEEGQDKWNKAIAFGSVILGNLMDVLSDVANALVSAFENPQKAIENFGNLIKNNLINRFNGLLELLPQLGKAVGLLFEGKFKEAGKVAVDASAKVVLGVENITEKIEEATVALGEFIEEQERELAIAGKISDQRAKADRLERDLIVARAKANKDRAQALENSVNKEKFSIEERIGFLKEAARIEQEITDQAIVAAKLRFEAKVEENKLANSTKDDLREEAELKARILDLEFQRLTKQKEVTGQIQAFNAEQKAADDKLVADKKAREDKETADKEAKRQTDLENASRDRVAQIELDELEIERKRDLGERTLEDELALLEAKRIQDTSNTDLRESEIEAINKRYAQEKDRIKQLEVKTQEATDKAVLNSAIAAAGQAFGISQELAVAKMLMNAPEAIGNVWTQAAKQPTLPQVILHGVVGTATVVGPIAQGLAQIKQARFSKKKGGSSGGGSISRGAGASASLPTATSTEVDDAGANNLARLGVDSSIGDRASATASANVSGGSSGDVTFSENSYSKFQRQVQFKEDKSRL